MALQKTIRTAFLSLGVLGAAMMSGCILSNEDEAGTVKDHAGPNTPVTVENAQTVFNMVFGTIKGAMEEPLSKPSAVASETRTINGSASGKIVVKTTPTANGYTEELEITDFSNDGELFIGGKLTNDMTTTEHGETGNITGDITVAGFFKGKVGVDVMMENFGDYFMVQGMVTVGGEEVSVFFHPTYTKVAR